MYFLGIDPDTHSTAIGIVDDSGTPMAAYIIRVKKTTKGDESLVPMFRAIEALFSRDSYAGDAMPLPTSADDISAVAIEGQEIYHGVRNRTKNTKSILKLGPVSGACALACIRRWPKADCLMPQPKEWKGQVPKSVHQARILGKLGLEYKKVPTSDGGYCYPVGDKALQILGARAMNQGDWKHITDAFGLALFARDKFTFASRKRVALTTIKS